MTIASGTKLGRYDIRSQLGAGAMGEVYLAQDTILGRRVALKILPREFAAMPIAGGSRSIRSLILCAPIRAFSSYYKNLAFPGEIFGE